MTRMCPAHPAEAVRGAAKPETAVGGKMPSEIMSYLRWKKAEIPEILDIELVQEKESELEISDADSDVLFEGERRSLSMAEYQELKALALRSACDFERLYQAIPDKNKSCLPVRKTFYGQVPRTMKGQSGNAGNADWNGWKVRRIFWITGYLTEAMAKAGRCGRF